MDISSHQKNVSLNFHSRKFQSDKGSVTISNKSQIRKATLKEIKRSNKPKLRDSSNQSVFDLIDNFNTLDNDIAHYPRIRRHTFNSFPKVKTASYPNVDIPSHQKNVCPNFYSRKSQSDKDSVTVSNKSQIRRTTLEEIKRTNKPKVKTALHPNVDIPLHQKNVCSNFPSRKLQSYKGSMTVSNKSQEIKRSNKPKLGDSPKESVFDLVNSFNHLDHGIDHSLKVRRHTLGNFPKVKTASYPKGRERSRSVRNLWEDTLKNAMHRKSSTSEKILQDKKEQMRKMRGAMIKRSATLKSLENRDRRVHGSLKVEKEREKEFQHIEKVMSSRKKSLSQRQRPKDFRVHGSIHVEKERQNEFQHIQEVVSLRNKSFSKPLAPRDCRVHDSMHVEKERENEFQHIQEVVSLRKANFSKSLNSTETKSNSKNKVKDHTASLQEKEVNSLAEIPGKLKNTKK